MIEYGRRPVYRYLDLRTGHNEDEGEKSTETYIQGQIFEHN